MKRKLIGILSACIIASSLTGCENDDHASKETSPNPTNAVSTNASVKTVTLDDGLMFPSMSGTWHGTAGTDQKQCTLTVHEDFSSLNYGYGVLLSGNLVWWNGDEREITGNSYWNTKWGAPYSTYIQFTSGAKIPGSGGALFISDVWFVEWDGANKLTGYGNKYPDGIVSDTSAVKYSVNMSR